MRADPRIHIGVFARAPVAGKCKTRLAHTLGAERAAEFAARSLDAIIERLHGLGATWSLAPASVTDAVWFETNGYAECLGETQSSGDLGRRMMRAHGEAFAEGANISAIIGSDCPDAPFDRLMDQLRDGLGFDRGIARSWLCPTDDGGYWCFALNRAAGDTYKGELPGVAWSSGLELQQTSDVLQGAGITVEQMLPAHDVDTYDDFVALVHRLEFSTSELNAKLEVPRWHRRFLRTLQDMLGEGAV